MKQLFFIVYFVPHISVFPQSSAPEQFISDSIALTKVALIKLQFDNLITFFEGQALSSPGFDIGVLLNEKLRLTLG